jgi:hypothetical protein
MPHKMTGSTDDLGQVCHSRFVVYGLFDPRTQELRYIGKSINGMRRTRQHTKAADLRRHGRTHKTAWVKSLLKDGLRPVVMLLKQCETAEELYPEEQRVIALFKGRGASLTNHTDGGPGRWGYKLSDETKAKLRVAAKKQKPVQHTAATKEGLRKLQLGRVHPEEHRLNMARAHGAEPFREETTGETFQSQSQAARRFGINQTEVRRVLVGERKTTHGLVFRYI